MPLSTDRRSLIKTRARCKDRNNFSSDVSKVNTSAAVVKSKPKSNVFLVSNFVKKNPLSSRTVLADESVVSPTSQNCDVQSSAVPDSQTTLTVTPKLSSTKDVNQYPRDESSLRTQRDDLITCNIELQNKIEQLELELAALKNKSKSNDLCKTEVPRPEMSDAQIQTVENCPSPGPVSVKSPVQSQSRKHRVLLLSDSHGRHISNMLKSLLPISSYSVISYVYPGCKLAHVVNRLTELTYDFTKDDYVVFLGGCNDITSTNFYINTLPLALNQILKHKNKFKMIFCSIPDRYDKPQEQHKINMANCLLFTKLTNSLCNLTNTVWFNTGSLRRTHFTSHGLHFNFNGKNLLARALAATISKNEFYKSFVTISSIHQAMKLVASNQNCTTVNVTSSPLSSHKSHTGNNIVITRAIVHDEPVPSTSNINKFTNVLPTTVALPQPRVGPQSVDDINNISDFESSDDSIQVTDDSFLSVNEIPNTLQ